MASFSLPGMVGFMGQRALGRKDEQRQQQEDLLKLLIAGFVPKAGATVQEPAAEGRLARLAQGMRPPKPLDFGQFEPGPFHEVRARSESEAAEREEKGKEREQRRVLEERRLELIDKELQQSDKWKGEELKLNREEAQKNNSFRWAVHEWQKQNDVEDRDLKFLALQQDGRLIVEDTLGGVSVYDRGTGQFKELRAPSAELFGKKGASDKPALRGVDLNNLSKAINNAQALREHLKDRIGYYSSDSDDKEFAALKQQIATLDALIAQYQAQFDEATAKIPSPSGMSSDEAADDASLDDDE